MSSSMLVFEFKDSSKLGNWSTNKLKQLHVNNDYGKRIHMILKFQHTMFD